MKRNGKLFMVLLLPIIAILLLAGTVSAAGEPRAVHEQDVLVDDQVHYWNTAGWDRSKLITYGSYQYTVYWDSDYKLALARRNLITEDIQTIKFDDELPNTPYGSNQTQRDNSHRNAAIGISPADGRLHLSFDHHADPMKYKVSRADFITNPPAVISVSDLGSTTSVVGSLDEITYPRFFNDKNGKLYMSFRNGPRSGDADSYLFKYDSGSGAWSPVAGTGMVFSRSGVVSAPSGRTAPYDVICESQKPQGGNPPIDPPNDYQHSYCRSAYEHDYVFDSSGSAGSPGRLHVTWTWREQYDDNSLDSGVYYMYSDDGGVTWYNNSGVQIADLQTNDPVRIDDPGLMVVSAPQESWIINNGGFALDSNNQPHIFTARSTVLAADAAGTNMHNIHYWRDASTGAWHSQYMESTAEPLLFWRTRGDIAIAPNDDIYAYSLYKNALYIYQASASDKWSTWKPYAVSETFMSGDGMKYDLSRWKNDRILSIPILDKREDGVTKYVIKEYRIGATTAPPAPRQLAPLREAGKITVRWDNTLRAEQYDVYRSTSIDSGFSKMATVYTQSLRSKYEDTTINGSTTYFYKIKAVNNEGESPFSDYVSSVAPCNSSDSLKGYWRMDELAENTALDYSSCNGNHGTLVNQPGWANGIREGAVSFNGANSYIEIPDSSSLDGMNALTVSVWVNLAKIPAPGKSYVLVGKDANSSQASYRLAINASGGGHFVVNTGGNWYGAGTKAEFTGLVPGVWYHIVGVYDGTNVKVYINGSLQGTGSQPISGAIVNGTSPLRLGFSAASSTDIQVLNGRMDEVRIYNRALSVTEINELNQIAGCGSDSLTGHWRMDEASGSTVSDSSPCGMNSGILRGGAGWTTGKNGAAISLDGVDDYAEIPDHSSLGGMSALTVSAWVKLDQLPSSGKYFTVAGKDQSGSEASYRIAIGSNGTGHFVVSTTGNYWYTAGTQANFTTALSPGTWYYITGTYDGTTVKVYVNGSLQGSGSQAISGMIVNGTSPLRIGYPTSSNVGYFKGAVDDVRIYDRALTGAELTALYQSY